MKMRSALLCASSEEKLFLIEQSRSVCGRSGFAFSRGGVVAGNGRCSAAFYESMALRAGTCSPERADFPRPGEDVTAGDKKGNLSRSD